MTLVLVQANYPGTSKPIRRGTLLVTIVSGPSGVAYRNARYGGTSFYELDNDGYLEVEQIANDDPELDRADTITKFEIPGIITTYLRIPMGGPVSWTDPAIQVRPDPPREWAPIQGRPGVPGAGLPSVLSYGGVGDGRDDRTAIQDGLEDIAGNGAGGLLLPGGYNWAWAEDLVVPAGVDLVGPASGKRTPQTKLTALGADARIIVGERGEVNQGGVLRDLAIDGAGVARNPLYIGLAVTRYFERLTVMGSTEQGIVVDGAQNCTFLGIDVLDSAGDAWVFDGGTGGHVLLRVELGAFGGSAMVFQASYDTTGDGRVYYQPTHIRILSAILERAFEDGAAFACILATAADRVKFYDPVFAQAAAVTNGDPDENALVVVDYDGSNGASLCELHLDGATFNGASLSAAARLEAQSGLFITGHTTFKNCAPAGIVANGGYANLDGHQIWANTPVRFGGSSSTDGIADGIFYTHREAPVRVARPTDTQVAYAVHVDGEPFDRLQILASGLIQVGDGTSPPTAQWYLGADGHNIRTNMRLSAADGIVPLVKAGTISDSDFVHTPPNGTLAVDTATPALWFRAGGVWTSVGSDAGVTSAIAAAIAAHSAASDPHGDRAYALAQIAAAVTGVFKDAGPLDCSANPNYPAASKGDAYVVTVAGKVGGASGTTVEVGDVVWATANNAGGTQASVGASWSVLAHHLVGALLAANNLSDIANPATALANLGGVATTDARLSDSRAPSGAAGGALTGTYPNPTIADGSLTPAKVAGTAVVTTDARLSDSRTPSGTAGGALSGTYPNPTIADGSLAPAKVAGTAVVTADSRLADARTPTAHASTHVGGGTDAIATAVASGAAGLLSGTDKAKLDNFTSLATALAGATVPKWSLDRLRAGVVPRASVLDTSMDGSTTTMVTAFGSANSKGYLSQLGVATVVRIDDEEMLISASTAGQPPGTPGGTFTFTVTRGVNGTTAAAHTAGAKIRTDAVMNVCICGDSITYTIADDIRRDLDRRFGGLGLGFRGIWRGNEVGFATGIEWTFTGTAPTVATGVNDIGPWVVYSFASGSGNYATWTAPPEAEIGQLDVYWVDVPGGTGNWSYSTDGGTTWVNNPNYPGSRPAAPTLMKSKIVVENPATLLLRAANAAGTGAAQLFSGVDVWSTRHEFGVTTGVKFHEFGYTGNTLANFAVADTGGDFGRIFDGDAASLVPMLVIVGPFSNDSVFSSATAAYATNLATIVSRVSTYADVLFLAVYDQDRETQTAVVRATTAALPSCTYANGTAGVGATLTATANGALSIDGGAPTVGQRVLVKNQASSFQNGVYTVTATGSAGAPFVLTRATDFDTAAEVLAGLRFNVTTGTTNGGTLQYVTSADSPTIGSGAITFSTTPTGSTYQANAIANRAAMTAAGASGGHAVLNLYDAFAAEGFVGWDACNTLNGSVSQPNGLMIDGAHPSTLGQRDIVARLSRVLTTF